MGTVFRIVVHGRREPAAAAASEVFESIDRLEQVLSDYRDDSELVQACREAWREPKVISPTLYEVLAAGLELGRATGGALDITVRPFVELWRLARHQKRLPDPEQLAEARRRVGIDKVLLNPRTRSLRLAVPGMKLDLGAIGKGYAADQALRQLQSLGFASAMVDAGGDLALGLPPPGRRGWRVQIGAGTDRERLLVLSRCSVATSGDGYQFVEIDGIRYSHIIDPRTGIGVTHQGSATVIADEAIRADALATALMVVPMEDGEALTRRLSVESEVVRRSPGELTKIVRTPGFPA